MTLSWCVNTVEEKFRKNRLLAFGEPKLRRMSVKLAEEFNRRRGEQATGFPTILIRLYGYWLLSDLIVWIISLPYVLLTAGTSGIISELFVSLVLGAIPFPINIIVNWQINAYSVVFQTVVFFVLVYFSYMRNREQ